MLLLRQATEETLWPTRCAICDVPGEVLCSSCVRQLPYIDHLKSCPTCGAPFGETICCECNHFILSWKHLDTFPLDGCISATMLTPETRRIITCYKDQGERHLIPPIAHLMAACIPYRWLDGSLLVPIPTRPHARRTRGFDHMKLLTSKLQTITGLPLERILSTTGQKDQRLLNAQERLCNMTHTFSVVPDAHRHLDQYLSSTHHDHDHALNIQRIIIVDDIMTTGATLFAAADALRNELDDQHRKLDICALTFARVP